MALKHNDFLKQEIKNLLDSEIICKSMFPWASLIVVVEKHTPEGLPKQFTCVSIIGSKTPCYWQLHQQWIPRRALSHLYPCQKLMHYSLY